MALDRDHIKGNNFTSMDEMDRRYQVYKKIGDVGAIARKKWVDAVTMVKAECSFGKTRIESMCRRGEEIKGILLKNNDHEQTLRKPP